MLSWIHAIVSLGDRRPGSDGAARTRDFIAEQLKQSGFTDIRREAVPTTCWTPEQWALEVSDKRGAWFKHPAFWMPLSPATTTDGVVGAPVYVRQGTDIEDYNIAGSVVVFDQFMGRLPVSAIADSMFDPDNTLSPHREDTLVSDLENLDHIFKIAKEKNAVGLVGLLTDFPYNAETFCAPPLPGGRRPPLPMLWAPRDAARNLLQDLLSRRIAALRIVSQSREQPCTDQNIAAFLPGRTGRWILVRAHYGSPFAGAVQDATGVAVTLALARRFAAQGAPRLNHGLIFLFTAARTQGAPGADAFFKAHPDLLEKIGLDITIGRIGRDCTEKRDGLTCTDLPAPRAALTANLDARAAAALEDVIKQHGLIRTAILPREAFAAAAGHTLSGMKPGKTPAAGIPSIDFLSWPPYVFSREDTLDKVAEDQLEPVANTFEDLIIRMDKK
jgi:hypothetical protein